MYVQSLEIVTSFKYLGSLLVTTDDDLPAVIFNLQKAQKIWSHIYRILGRGGSYPIISGHFYLAVVQEILVYGTDTWVVTPIIGRLLGSFHHRVVIRLEGMKPQRYTDEI